MYIAIIIIAILIILLYLYLKGKTADDSAKYVYNEIKEHLKTGDIILFSCKSHGSMADKGAYLLRTKFLGSEYGHVGLIVRTDNDIYLIECTDKKHTGEKHAHLLNKSGKGGIRIIQFDKLIEEYYQENAAVFAVMSISKRLPNDLILNQFYKYDHYIFEDKKILFTLAAVDIVSSPDTANNLLQSMRTKNNERNEKMMCSEFVYDILYRCGVVHYYSPKIFWPHHFTNGKLQNLTKYPYTFTDPIKFKYI